MIRVGEDPPACLSFCPFFYLCPKVSLLFKARGFRHAAQTPNTGVNNLSFWPEEPGKQGVGEIQLRRELQTGIPLFHEWTNKSPNFTPKLHGCGRGPKEHLAKVLETELQSRTTLVPPDSPWRSPCLGPQGPWEGPWSLGWHWNHQPQKGSQDLQSEPDQFVCPQNKETNTIQRIVNRLQYLITVFGLKACTQFSLLLSRYIHGVHSLQLTNILINY